MKADPDKWGVRECIACGRCGWGCPLSRRQGDFSPRTFAERYLSGESPAHRSMWSCTSCAVCTHLCERGVGFHQFIREARAELRGTLPPESTHGGIMDVLTIMNAKGGLRPRGGAWITPDLDLDPDGSTILYVGCISYLDVLFRHLRGDVLNIPRAAVILLNAMGIRPRLLNEERCCGHDAYWKGEDDEFLRLAELNVEAIEGAGVKEVITICPEGYTAFTQLYPTHLGPLGFEVRHMTEVLSRGIKEGAISLSNNGSLLTYQDPCRATRHADLTGEARTIIGAMGELREMPRSGGMAACCGHSGWVNCDSMTKDWQLERLREAESTGADTLITSCPKCLIHLSCATYSALGHGEGGPRIKDLYVMAAERLKR